MSQLDDKLKDIIDKQTTAVLAAGKTGYTPEDDTI